MRVLGLALGDAGAAAALVEDGIVVAAATEERFSRQRLDPNYPAQAVEFVLGGRSPDVVAASGEPTERFTRVLTASLASPFPAGAGAFVRNMKAWIGHHLWTRDSVSRRLDVDPDRITFVPRDRALAKHALAAAGWEQGTVVVADTAGDWACTSTLAMTPAGLRVVESVAYPHSLGLFAATIAGLLGFALDDLERLPALAGFGRPVYATRMRRMLVVATDPGKPAYTLDPAMFDFARLAEWPRSSPWTGGLTDQLGAPRDARRPLPFPGPVEAEDQRYADIAASFVVVVEEALTEVFKRAATAGAPSAGLCFTGPVAACAPGAARMAVAAGFGEVFIPDEPGPAGGAVGAALIVGATPDRADSRMAGPFLGQAYDERADVLALMQMDTTWWQRWRKPGSRPIRGARLEFCDAPSPAMVAEELVAGRVVGWCRGAFEWGPHARGHRSLLAGPESAPALLAVRGQPAWCPVELVTQSADPALNDVIAAHAVITGIVGLAHADLCEDDAPLVASPADAVLLFMRTDVDTLILGNTLCRKLYP